MASSIPTGGTIFSITPIRPGSGKESPIYFRATFESITDSHRANWDVKADVGRADRKFLYNSVGRSLTVPFKVVIPTKDEYDKQYDAVNSLIELTHPVYKSGQGYNGLFAYIKIGKFISFYGVIDSIEMDVDTEYPWHVKSEGLPPERPIVLDVTLQATWVGEKKPQYKKWALYDGSFGTGIKYPQ